MVQQSHSQIGPGEMVVLSGPCRCQQHHLRISADQLGETPDVLVGVVPHILCHLSDGRFGPGGHLIGQLPGELTAGRQAIDAAFEGLSGNRAFAAAVAYSDGLTTPEPAPPPPPPPPPPAPEPPRNFIVFFDWDQSVITPEALAILREAAAVAQSQAPVRIVATGHADRSGASDYNDRLSARRAQAVRSRMAQLGIDPISIATFARGESDPLVATPDGVREPQNRRVEIVIQ